MIAERNEVLHFLVAVDGSEHALAAVRWIAQIAAAGASLRCTLLNVRRPIISGAVAPASIAPDERNRGAADILEHASAILRPTGLRFAIEEQMDDAAAAVVARAQVLGCDAIVIGRRGLGVLRSVLLGSVSAEVVRQSGVPVIIVSPMTAGLPVVPLRLLVAVDGSESAMRAAAFASRLAASAAGEVHFLYVEPALTVAGSILGSREKVIEHWSGRQAEKVLAGASGLLDRSRVTCAEHVAASDEPQSAIMKAARDYSCSIIAMGTRGLGPVTGLLLGSVAQSVLKQAHREVAAVVLVR